ncbi:MAG: endonuclease III domain-containing protein [Candidatus Ratteibacteria bacterium]|nr:endonuclease III domain-containing protein [Candidatus Ratteibacteria bacterium]
MRIHFLMEEIFHLLKLIDVFDKLYRHFGEQFWWPASSPFEVIVGAVLTQNTAWTNVEKAITNLKRRDLLHPEKISRLPLKELEKLVHSSGFYRQKAKRLKSVSQYLEKSCRGDWDRFFSFPSSHLRPELLEINGLGPETVDSILLYAGRKPVFVIDAYTKRLSERLGISQESDYEALRSFFENNLPRDERLFNEFHALIVALAKNYCRTKPACRGCPLKKNCRFAP